MIAQATSRGWLATCDDETGARFAIYVDLLRKWNASINLVSNASLSDAIDRHFADSSQLMDLCPQDSTRWADLGSGGGFPGLVVAILAATRRPNLSFVLVESDLRKATFLRTVSRETGVPVDVRDGRIEALEPLGADVISARALAPLERLLGFAERHLAQGGTCLFLKGAQYEREIEDARRKWSFDLTVHPSKVQPGAAALEIKGPARA